MWGPCLPETPGGSTEFQPDTPPSVSVCRAAPTEYHKLLVHNSADASRPVLEASARRQDVRSVGSS